MRDIAGLFSKENCARPAPGKRPRRGVFRRHGKFSTKIGRLSQDGRGRTAYTWQELPDLPQSASPAVTPFNSSFMPQAKKFHQALNMQERQ
jgi:hypothetical protein